MKNNKILPITLLAGVLMLSACASKGGDTETDSTSPSSEPVYTITEAEFSALKSKLSDPKIFLEGNFTVDLNASDVSFKNKFANGKVDCYVQGNHFVFDFDVSTYNATTQKANGDTYEYDDSDETWSKETGEIDVAKYASISLGFEEVFNYSPSFDSFTYNEETRQYSGSKTIDEYTAVTKFVVKDGQFISYEVVGHFEYTFSDYGTTTVALPTVA